jgi:hypothetical protein
MKSTVVILAVVALILVVIFGPWITIWAMNTLFPALAIPYTLETWAATILLGMALRGNVSVKKD